MNKTAFRRGEDLAEPGAEFRFSPAVLPDLVALVDVVAILLAATLAYVAILDWNPRTLEYYVFATGFIAVAAVFLLNRGGMYGMGAIMRPLPRSDIVIVSVGAAFLFFLTIAFSLKVSEIYSRLWTYGFAGGAVILVMAGRVAAASILARMARERLIGRNLVVLGTGRQAERFLERMARVSPYFTAFGGVFSLTSAEGAQSCAGLPVLGDAEDLVARARENRVDDIVIAMPWNDDERLAEVIERLKELPVNVYISTDLIGYHLSVRPDQGQLTGLPVFEVVRRPISGWQSLVKTIEDYLLASVLVLALAPLLGLIALAIRIDSPGPVFFMQRRLGFNNREFKIYKFRTMHHRDRSTAAEAPETPEAPETHVPQATRDDPRVTRVGRILRRSSLDELPQLFNVLDGTMSLVGPRPHAIAHNIDYGRRIRGYFQRHKVKPGITGWAQVNGLRGETDTIEKMEARVAHDVHYVENWSLLLDLRILAMTFFIVLFQKNAY